MTRSATEAVAEALDVPGFAGLLNAEALTFVSELHRRFGQEREELLQRRQQRQRWLQAGVRPGYPEDGVAIRAGDWRIRPAPDDLQDRRVEITGPADAKMVINALNSGARVFMADLEDSLAPSWPNVIAGHLALYDAARRELRHISPEGKVYELGPTLATLVMRPRGWHLLERHVTVAGQPVSASLFDAGLYLFHNAEALRARGSGPYMYLPKLEGRREAALWRRVFTLAERELGLKPGTIRATMLIETVPAALEMEELLYELRDYATGLNAGRWDYIFSMVKTFHNDSAFVLPDRGQVKMTVPFMRAYSDRLVQACHRHGAHAIGGMAAFIPNRRDPKVNEEAFAQVRQDKQREADAGFDGTWVAHPDLVPIAREAFDAVLGDRPHQMDRVRADVRVTAAQLLDTRILGGTVTRDGVRTNISVAIRYLESWLHGTGAVTLDNLMEDAATAEISRAQLWQWIHHRVRLDTGETVDRDLYAAERDRWLAATDAGRYRPAAELLDSLVLTSEFADFLTIPAYSQLP
ncbi:malate synthase A [Conexibacter sp. S30A1]|jgi:malate synthase|uniref:malate synthase A n=1 Tax=Conexibacter sp. S30A1 TaxID=2937800 RepID=UPI00200FC8BD|nr:malate synthase A [Conexibacter sp. S30A1]